jgi:hypothetical protein
VATGYITLGELARFRTAVNVACNRCERRGRLGVARLIALNGSHMPVPELRRAIAADCPLMQANKRHDRCGIHFPGLAGRCQ